MMQFPFMNPEQEFDSQTSKSSQCRNQSREELKLVSLRELLQPLLTAVGQRQPWVEDFQDDQLMLSADSYEVIHEFARLQSGTAATPS
ncbi:MAG: hypothetical protein ACR2NP_04425 [Pirellulaceae bacterium]